MCSLCCWCTLCNSLHQTRIKFIVIIKSTYYIPLGQRPCSGLSYQYLLTDRLSVCPSRRPVWFSWAARGSQTVIAVYLQKIHCDVLELQQAESSMTAVAVDSAGAQNGRTFLTAPGHSSVPVGLDSARFGMLSAVHRGQLDQPERFEIFHRRLNILPKYERMHQAKCTRRACAESQERSCRFGPEPSQSHNPHFQHLVCPFAGDQWLGAAQEWPKVPCGVLELPAASWPSFWARSVCDSAPSARALPPHGPHRILLLRPGPALRAGQLRGGGSAGGPRPHS